jgi:hypothetical protein
MARPVDISPAGNARSRREGIVAIRPLSQLDYCLECGESLLCGSSIVDCLDAKPLELRKAVLERLGEVWLPVQDFANYSKGVLSAVRPRRVHRKSLVGQAAPRERDPTFRIRPSSTSTTRSWNTSGVMLPKSRSALSNITPPRNSPSLRRERQRCRPDHLG